MKPLHGAVFDAIHRCREAVFDAVIDEVLHPSEKMPLRHLGINQFADHLFQLGKPSQAYCSLTSKTATLLEQVTMSILERQHIDQWSRYTRHMPIQWSLHSVGASAETHAKNRQELYEVTKALEQAAKKRQAAPARQGKKGTSPKHNKAGSKVGSSALVDQPGSPALSKKHKSGTAADGPAAASGQIDGSVESPGTPAACCMPLASCLR